MENLKLTCDYVESDICVVVTCYNETLVEVIYCIESILANNIPDINIIIINDNPSKVARSNRIKKLFPNIFIKNNKENFGISCSRNFGIDYANLIDKPLIAFCDSDDTWVSQKISKQLFYINRGYDVVSTGMYELTYCTKIKRIPIFNELNFGGNPIFLSSALLRRPSVVRFRNEIVEDRQFFKDLFKYEFHMNRLKIVPEGLVNKYNYPLRRGRGGVFQSISNSKNSISRKFIILILKTFSVRSVKINFIKFIIFKLISINFSKKSEPKRISLSLNFTSSEYKNLKKFSRVYNIPFFLHSFFSLGWQTRNRIFCDAVTVKQVVASVIYGKLEGVKYVYVGLSGANLIKDYVLIPSETLRFHIVHGRNVGEKFNTYTDAALLQSTDEKMKVPTRKQWCFAGDTEFIYTENTAVWFHGFEKGSGYGIKNFLNDLLFFRHLKKRHKYVRIAPHPLAKFFEIYLKVFTQSFLEFNIYKKNIVSCDAILSSSPSLSETTLKHYAAKKGISFVNLRADPYKSSL